MFGLIHEHDLGVPLAHLRARGGEPPRVFLTREDDRPRHDAFPSRFFDSSTIGM